MVLNNIFITQTEKHTNLAFNFAHRLQSVGCALRKSLQNTWLCECVNVFVFVSVYFVFIYLFDSNCTISWCLSNMFNNSRNIATNLNKFNGLKIWKIQCSCELYCYVPVRLMGGQETVRVCVRLNSNVMVLQCNRSLLLMLAIYCWQCATTLDKMVDNGCNGWWYDKPKSDKLKLQILTPYTRSKQTARSERLLHKRIQFSIFIFSAHISYLSQLIQVFAYLFFGMFHVFTCDEKKKFPSIMYNVNFILFFVFLHWQQQRFRAGHKLCTFRWNKITF